MLNAVIEFANKKYKQTYLALSSFVTIDDRHVEVEPYEETVDRAEVFSTPSGSRSASPVSVDRSLPPAQSPPQGPRAPRDVGGGSHTIRKLG